MLKLIGPFIDLFITKTKWVNTISILITLVGLVALLSMKKDLHPPFKFNHVVVSLSYPNASAHEVERLITYPLEEKLRAVADVEEMRSTSHAGYVYITLTFPQSVKDIRSKIEEIRALVQTETRLLPSEIRNFQVNQSSDDKIFLANLGLTGLDPKNLEHHGFMQIFEQKLKAVEGISFLETSLLPLHIFVKFDPEVLRKKAIKISDLRRAIRSELGANTISHNSVSGKSWLLEFAPRPVDLKRISRIELRNNGTGNILKLSDVAQVQYDQIRNEKYEFLLNGENAVEVSVFKSEKYDSIETFKAFEKALNAIEFPAGVQAKVLYDGPYFIQQQISVLLSNGIGGLALVLLLLGFVMGWKTALMTAIGLPISYFGTFIILKLLGINIDLISLVAMILVVGNLVDDAVIFSERYNQLLSEGITPEQAASIAAKELVVPVTGTILTIIFAFLPIVLLDSEISVIFMALPIVVGFALFLSWFETFFLLPNHMQHFVRKPSAERATAFFFNLAGFYKKILRHTLKFRYVYGLGSIALLVISLLQASKMPQDFNLSINAPQVEVAIVFKNEMNFNEVQEILKPLHEQIKNLPADELDFTETNLGWVYRQGKRYRGPKYATIRLVLNKKEVDVKTLRDKVQTQVQEILKNFKHDSIEEAVALATERGSAERRKAMATVQMSGKDQTAFALAEKEIINLIEKNKNSEINLSYIKPDAEGPENFKFNLDDNKISNLGLNKLEISEEIQALSGAYEIVETRSQERWLNIYLEPLEYSAPNINYLNSLRVSQGNESQSLKLSQIGSWEFAGVSERLTHLNGVRNLKLDFRFDDKLTNEQVVKKNIQGQILEIVKKYPSLEIKTVDANEQDKKGREWGLKIILLAGISIYIILALTLGSFSQPFIVGLPMPFALIGIIWALKLHGMELSLMVMLGLIGTMGVSVNDSIVMVHQVNLLWKKYGVQSAELVIEAAASRLRAILLIASCTLIGVFPTAYGIGGESGFTQPLAFSMGWGLSTSLLLTLFIIPAMLMVLNDISNLFEKFKNKIKNTKLTRFHISDFHSSKRQERLIGSSDANKSGADLSGTDGRS